MKENKVTSMAMVLAIAFATMTAVAVMAQDDGSGWPGGDSDSSWPGTEKASEPAPAPTTPAADTSSPSSGDKAAEAPKATSPAPRASSGGGGSAQGMLGKLLNTLISTVAKIGNLFGQATGMKIGGTTGSGIIALVIAFLLRDKIPDWARKLLFIGGGTMFAGSGANILQFLM